MFNKISEIYIWKKGYSKIFYHGHDSVKCNVFFFLFNK
jgi:hypothetical protein